MCITRLGIQRKLPLLLFILSLFYCSVALATPSETIQHQSSVGTLEFTQQTHYPENRTTKLRDVWRKFHFQLAKKLYEEFQEDGRSVDKFRLDWRDETSVSFYKRLVMKLSSDSVVTEVLIDRPILRNPIQYLKKNPLRNTPIELDGVSVKRIYDGEKLFLKIRHSGGDCKIPFEIESFEDLPVNFKLSNSGKYLAFQLEQRIELINLPRCVRDKNLWMKNASNRSIELGDAHRQSLGTPFDMHWIDPRDHFYALEYSMSARGNGQYIFVVTSADTYFDGPLVEWEEVRSSSLRLGEVENHTPVIFLEMEEGNKNYETPIPAPFRDKAREVLRGNKQQAQELMREAKSFSRDDNEQNMRKALELVKKAVRIDPDNWEAHEMLAETYMYFGGYQKEIDKHLFKAASIEGAPRLRLLGEIKRVGSSEAQKKARQLINNQ